MKIYQHSQYGNITVGSHNFFCQYFISVCSNHINAETWNIASMTDDIPCRFRHNKDQMSVTSLCIGMVSWMLKHITLYGQSQRPSGYLHPFAVTGWLPIHHCWLWVGAAISLKMWYQMANYYKMTKWVDNSVVIQPYSIQMAHHLYQEAHFHYPLSSVNSKPHIIVINEIRAAIF